MSVHPCLLKVTERIIQHSADSRARYLARLDIAVSQKPQRCQLSCTNQAHAWAAAVPSDKILLHEMHAPNIAIVSAYNDMLSSHQPLETFPAIIKQAVRTLGATAQFAGGVPAMCDGVTQGQAGMELSLFSRDVIAMASAVALSHNVFDGILCLGVCDKIVPGLLIGALQFGHLPCIFVPAGPMPSGISNTEKAKTRQLFAQGKIDRNALLQSEEASYHSPGTCTFYGTANSNQMLMEIMGIHLPGTAFVPPNTALREALTVASAQRIVGITAQSGDFRPLGKVINEQAIANAIVGLLATGGSTNHTLHLVAIARAAGILINWEDFNDLSEVVPLLAKVYPNGALDVNHFHTAGGVGFLIRELLDAHLLHETVLTVFGSSLRAYTQTPTLQEGQLRWEDAPKQSGNLEILRPTQSPFSANGGLKLLVGNLGRAIIKTSAVGPKHWKVEAPAIVFDTQADVLAAFKRGELEKDFVAVVRFQGPRANGMPELHQLTPALGVLQARGFKVALVTDGRMSGASGKIPAAIHVTPEATAGGPLAKVRTGDLICLDAVSGQLSAKVDAAQWDQRTIEQADLDKNQHGMGRELFATFRSVATSAEEGAVSLGLSH